MLAMHPQHQEKVFQEILSVMPEKNADLMQSDLDRLEFTDLCIRETLRLFPTVPLIGRVSDKQVELSNNIIIPPNVTFILCLRQLHIQEKYFGPTAKLFNPNRFLDESIKNLPATAYIPFSYGSRNCVGIYYAKAAIKLFTVHLIRNYRLETTYTNIDQLQFIQNLSIGLVGKHMIKLETRP